MNITIKQVNFNTVMENIESITGFSKRAFMENHEITKEAYKSTEASDKHHFRFLFDEQVVDMIQENERNKGCFFIAEENESRKIVAISVGKPYSGSTLSQDFMNTVVKSKSHFKSIIQERQSLMEKYQGEAPKVYHQTMTAVDPDYARKGLGTRLSLFVMKKIEELGFVAVASETSSAASQCVIRHLKEHNIQVEGIETALHLQLTIKPEAKVALKWFQEKKIPVDPQLMQGRHSLYNNDMTKKLFATLDALEKLSNKSAPINQRILELKEILKKEINGPDEQRGTPVQGAAYARDLTTLKRLIAEGADLDHPEPFYGGNVLHVAVEGGSKECVAELLAKAPRLADRKNLYGVTPREWAKTKNRPDIEALFNKLR